jgi:hypothetical protein
MWTANNVIGLLCLIAAAIVPWLTSDADAGRGMGSALTVLGGMLVGWSPTAPGLRAPDKDQRGTIAAGLALLLAGAVVVVGLGAFLWGCGSTDVRAEKSVHPFFDPGPPCVLTVDVDDVRAYRVRWDKECPIDMPTAWLCARLAEKAPGAKLPAVCTP